MAPDSRSVMRRPLVAFAAGFTLATVAYFGTGSALLAYHMKDV